MTKKRTKTNAELARQHGVTPRTISSWRSQGAPLADRKKLSTWLASRKNLAPGLIVSTPTNEPAPPPGQAQEPGAANALLRLQTQEVSAYQRLEDALGGSDPLAIRTARENWLRILEALRQYEKAVTEDARKSNALVLRSDVEKHVAALAYGCRIVSEGGLPELVRLIQGEPDCVRARQVARRFLWSAAITSQGFGQVYSVPAWLIKAFGSDLESYTGSTAGDIERVTALLREAGETLPTVADRQTGANE